MPKVVYIGTFDPPHGAHVGQLLRTNKYLPFSHVHICVNKNPSHKPNASTWQHRAAMANILLDSFDLPFEYSVLATTNPNAEELPAEVDYKIIGVDALIDDLKDPRRWQFATKWPLLVVSLPGIEKSALHKACTGLPVEIRRKVSYLYISESDVPMMSYDFDKREFTSLRVHSTQLREGRNRNFIPTTVREYIGAHQLYK